MGAWCVDISAVCGTVAIGVGIWKTAATVAWIDLQYIIWARVEAVGDLHNGKVTDSSI